MKNKCDHCGRETDDIDAFVDTPDYSTELIDGVHKKSTFCLACLRWNTMKQQMQMNRNLISLASHYEELILKHGILDIEMINKLKKDF